MPMPHHDTMVAFQGVHRGPDPPLRRRHCQFLPGHPPTAQGSLEWGEAYSSFGVATLNGGEEQGSI